MENFIAREVDTIEDGMLMMSLRCLYCNLFTKEVPAVKAEDIIRSVAG